jgi:hypothetical protein
MTLRPEPKKDNSMSIVIVLLLCLLLLPFWVHMCRAATEATNKCKERDGVTCTDKGGADEVDKG